MIFDITRILSNGGPGSISGTVTVNAVQAVKRVLLFSRRNHRPIRETVSGLDGGYAFNLLDTSQKYYVVAFDDTGAYNAKIADNLTAA